MKNEVHRGGLWCHDVLQVLDGWVDHELPSEVALRISDHVAECDRCARFGGRYARLVAALRTRTEPPAPRVVVERLLSGLSLPKQD